MFLVKRNGKKVDLALENNILFSSAKIGQRDTIFFICKKCGKDASRRVSLFKNIKNISDRDLYCQQCNTKENNLKKYGVSNTAKLNEVKEKIKQTNLKRYDVEYPTCSNEIKEKIKQTNLEKYGVKYPTCSNEIKEKIKQTNLKRYGVDNPLKNKEIQEKIKQTNLKRYGVDNPLKNKEIQEKIKQTNLKKYGFSFPLKNKEIQEKIKQTNLEKYGVEYVFQDKEVKEKIKQTNLEKYGVEFFQQFNCLNLKEVILKLKEKKIIVLNDLTDSDFNMSFNQWINKNTIILKSERNKKYKITTYSGALITNGGASNVSSAEIEIFNFIKSLNVNNIVQNSRKIISPYEIDIYLPDYNLAIEYNGLYWHSNYDKNYHINKTNLAKKNGIRLIQIFEDEWLFKKEIVKGRLRNFLNKNENKIHARKCLIKEIKSKEKNLFLEKYHIQGKDLASIKLGAFFENKLVGVMTFSRYRKALGRTPVKNEYELSRFAIIHNTNITGLASKLYKFFIRNYFPKKIISYSDLRWNTGNVYLKLGFEKIKTTNPNYWWCKNKKRFYRYKYRKSQLTNMKHYSKEKTEKEIMLLNGFKQVYDCGHLLFEQKF